MRPVIGVTTYLEPARWGLWERVAAVLPQSYVDGVVHAGGAPVLLPPLDGAADAMRAVDGLVLSGGADVDPARYGEPAHPRTVSNPDRDRWELAVLQAALDRRIPVLAICRGMQLLNVAYGGSLHQHLPDVGGAAEHLPSPGAFGSTAVRVAPSSRLAVTIGGEAAGLTVSCHHHQAVHRLGDELVPVAWADDGTVEAVEHAGHEFVLGVQWHPEEDAVDRRLFDAFVRKAAITP